MRFFQAIKTLGFYLVPVVMMVTSVGAAEHLRSSPLRIWGDFSSTYRTLEIDEGESEVSDWLNTLTVNASSYIWRPWFALINGGLTLSGNESKFSEQPTVGDEFITGNVRFDLFPTSRFPFMMHYNESRNQQDDNLFNRDVTTTEYGLGQQYRTLNGKHHYRANYRQNSRDDNNVDSFVNESLMLSSTNRFAGQSVSTDFQIDETKNKSSDEEAFSYSFATRHSYRDDVNYSVESLASASEVENDFLTSTTHTKTAQFSSLLSWQPEDLQNLNLTVSLRLSELALDRDQDVNTPPDEMPDTDNATANINQGLIYRYSEKLTFNESVNANYFETDNEVGFIGNESIGFTFIPDRVSFIGGDYGWSISSSYNNQHGDVETQKFLGSQFGHSLAHDFSTKNRYDLRTNLTQSFNYDYRSAEQDRKSIDHSFSTTWSESVIGNQSVVRFVISDSRSQDDEDSLFQLINIQYSGFFRLSRFSRLVGDITFQRSRQKENSVETSRKVSNGQLEYSRERLFKISRLNFRSQLKLSRQQSKNELFIASLDDDFDSSQSWENALTYRIGRLEIHFNLNFIKTDSKYDQIMRFQFTRSFGDL